MPYILQDKRDRLDPLINALHAELVSLESDDESNNMEGNMNYLITRLIRMVYGMSYAEVNAAMGMLECIKQEHYRTQAGPYEDQKKFENGDVDAEATPVVLRTISVMVAADETAGSEMPPTAGVVDMNPKLQYDSEPGTKEQLFDPEDRHLR